jgi:hypothetical protein
MPDVIKTYWNGEPCQAAMGTAEVADASFPLYWARELVGQRIAVVRVDYFDDLPMYLDDQGGKGWRKVTEGRGSPRVGHRNVAIKPGSFQSAGAS